MSGFPDYYALLSIPHTATQDEIRQAYKRESLKTHPDRLATSATPEEKQRATETFQAVADAYYVLSDPARRREYNILRSQQQQAKNTTDPRASSDFFTAFTNLFGGKGGTPQDNPDAPGRPDAEGIFGDVFEELLRPEVERWSYWKYAGAAGGGALGYIVANVPGMMVGGYAGHRLGAIRDAKGKPVAVVFAQLGGSQKAEILRALAMKVFGSANAI